MDMYRIETQRDDARKACRITEAAIMHLALRCMLDMRPSPSLLQDLSMSWSYQSSSCSSLCFWAQPSRQMMPDIHHVGLVPVSHAVSLHYNFNGCMCGCTVSVDEGKRTCSKVAGHLHSSCERLTNRHLLVCSVTMSARLLLL